MTLPTLSRIPLAMACVGSQVLPTIESDSGLEAAAGTAKHDYAGALLAGRRHDEALDAVPEEHRDGVLSVPWDAILPRLAGLSVEAAYAYDVGKRTTRRLGANLGRRYNQAPSEVAGSLDYSAESPAVYVDLKTGRSTQARAAEHWQLRAGAVALSALTGATEVTVGILLAREGARPWFDLATLDALQLGDDADALADLAERIEAGRKGGTPTLRTGSHCTYCPARLSCPAQTSLVRAMAMDPAKAVPVGLLTREERTATYHRWRLAQSVLDEVKGQLIAAALVEPIEVGPGTLYGSHATTRETLDGQTVADTLSTLYGPQVAAAGVELSATKASVGRAVKAEVERRKAAGGKATQAGLVREAMAAVTAAGGVTVASSSRIEEYPGDLPPLLGDADAPPDLDEGPLGPSDGEAREAERVAAEARRPPPSPPKPRPGQVRIGPAAGKVIIDMDGPQLATQLADHEARIGRLTPVQSPPWLGDARADVADMRAELERRLAAASGPVDPPGLPPVELPREPGADDEIPFG